MKWVTPVISHELNFSSIFIPVLGVLLSYIFFRLVVPRSLAGLQVAFPTGPKRYEVHTVTKDAEEATILLKSRSMKFGIIAYTTALSGALIILIEFISLQLGLIEAYHSWSLGFAFGCIVLPAILSATTSLWVQLIKPQRRLKATLQDSSAWEIVFAVILAFIWFFLIFAMARYLIATDMETSRVISIVAFFAFMPSIIAYGRILGSSWAPLRASSGMLGRGEPSPFHPEKPTAREQVVSQLVFINTAVMPYVAINTLLSLILLAINPDMFIHSDRVNSLPEYRIQSTIMEEGGVIGFFAIELFSFIEEPGIRVPLVSLTLMFLLFNVAIVGFLFVYEVARILFLDIEDVAGYGSIKLADSRLIRSERSQQAKVINFCFTGFAGQSMLLLALAMLTFWDSTFLPTPSQCGAWQDNMCVLMEKNALEELTWMLSSGGQVAFLYVWLRSKKYSQSLENIKIDAKVGEERAKMVAYEKAIFRMHEPFEKMMNNDSWHRALMKLQSLFDDIHEESVQGLTLSKRSEASMELFAGLGRWEESEQMAISVLAMRSGKRERIARMLLLSASLSQRDIKEATPRLGLMKGKGVEEARIRWMYSLLNPTKRLDTDSQAMLMVDPLTRRNIDLIKRYWDGKPSGDLVWRNDGPGRLHIIGEIGRLRLFGKSELALNKLEAWINTFEVSRWAHGQIARLLCMLDIGQKKESMNILHDLAEHSPRHPHVRWLTTYFGEKHGFEELEPESTGLNWIDERNENWMDDWPITHTITPSYVLSEKQLRKHAWNANAWVIRRNMKGTNTNKSAWKKLDWDIALPFASHLLYSGIIITVGGFPVDLGFPGWLDFEEALDNGLLD